MGRTAIMRLQRFILLSTMPLELHGGDTSKSYQKLGHGTQKSLSIGVSASRSSRRSPCTPARTIEPKTLHAYTGFDAHEGDILFTTFLFFK